MKHVVIIGNGISGITTARHIRKNSDHRITVISAESDYFYSRTALMYIYMGHMRLKETQPYENWFWEKNRIGLKKAYVQRVDTDKKTLYLNNNETLDYDVLVLAVGSKPRKFGWPGVDSKGIQGLYSLQDLEMMEQNTQGIKNAVIVGGGLIGVEMAEMLQTRNVHVTFLVREDWFWAGVMPEEEGALINRHMIDDHHVELKLQTELKEIVPDSSGRVQHIITNHNEKIDCQFVGLTIGVQPNTDFLKDSNIEINRGIVVNRFMETNVPDVYALGDCAEFSEPFPNRRPIEQVWYTGRMMGEALAQTICGKPTQYSPGIWFNSAKFFDIEYQTYGWVWNQLKEGEETFYWEHPNGKICLRLVYDQQSKRLLGINVFGMRLRHEVCDRWIKEERSIDHVIAHLRDANFDPEFYKQHESAIVASYNQQTGSNVQLKKRSWARIFNRKTQNV
ncbi:MAG TPA: FAD-dependent oxidoreductase [Microscillaceae bacterium]|nr:FAD-dependent oxidoreductase [Microscillaceae bacterium]